MTRSQVTYYNDQELPVLTLDWSNAGEDFSTGWTFTVKLARTNAATTNVLNKTAGITSTATTVTIAWSTTDWAGLEASAKGTDYYVYVYARRNSDSKDLEFRPEAPITLTLKAAVGTSAVSPSSYPITVTAASVTLADTGGYFTATNVEDALAEHVADTVDAHDASAISVLDSGGYYTGTNVETVLAEVGATAGPWLAGQRVASEVSEGVTLSLSGPVTTLTIPTYDGSNVVTHPSVVVVDPAWNGYRYWMAFTPYPGADSSFENPSIVASNDGTTWVVPSGLTNPIEAKPAGASDYNSDTHLVFASDGYMYCFWRAYMPSQPGTEERFYYRRSLDGITWGDKTLIRSDNAATRRLVSPAFIEEPDGSWRIYAVDILPATNVVQTLTAPTLTGTWTTPTTVTGVVVRDTQEPWHLDAHRYGNEYVLLYHETTSGGGAPGIAYRAVSTDGTTFRTDPRVFPIAASTYRPSFLPARVDGREGYEVFYSTLTAISRGFVRMDFTKQDDPALMAGAIVPLQPYTVGDAMNRADSAVTPGSTSSGAAYTVSAGTAGISNKAFYSASATNTRATVASTLADGEFGVTLTTAQTSGEAWLVFRYFDANNYWRFGWSSTSLLKLQKIVSGSGSDVFTVSRAPVSGDRLQVICLGNRIFCYLNERQVGYTLDTHQQTATNIGLQTQNGTARFRYLYAKA